MAKDNKNIMQNLYKIAFLLLIGFSVQAQEILTLEDAVKISLKIITILKLHKTI